MRIAIASGKGGAGKTTVAASLAAVWDAPAVVVDADVEAPNMHLFCEPEIQAAEDIFLEVPQLDAELCTHCGACGAICRFKAIAKLGKAITLFTDMCHGCGGCFAVCPTGALTPGRRLLGALEYGTALDGKHAFLMGRARIGEAMTPPQIRALQKKLEGMLAEPDPDGRRYEDAILDAPPGVSCPAMTVAREADAIVLVAEPTPFGIHDFTLAHKAFLPLGKPIAVVINRAALPGGGDGELLAHCRDNRLPVLGALPFSREIAGHYAHGGIAAAYSSDWRERFVALRDAVRDFGAGGTHHA